MIPQTLAYKNGTIRVAGLPEQAHPARPRTERMEVDAEIEARRRLVRFFRIIKLAFRASSFITSFLPSSRDNPTPRADANPPTPTLQISPPNPSRRKCAR
tara:strand:+ start:75 stop:374 length:300 start_codon:yes stop_codon:yes gene_type:complete